MRSTGAILAVTALTAGTIGIVLWGKRERAGRGAGASPPRPRPPAPPQASTGRAGATTMTTTPEVHPGTFTPTLESWRAYFITLAPDIPIAGAMAWQQEESGGNVCAIGVTPPAGATQPQEYGLAQLNAKDPSNLKIATPEALRAMCGTGPSHAEWERVLRPLTEAERIMHAQAAVALMRHCADKIDAFIGTPVGTRGIGTIYSPADYWRLVKCYHASSAVAGLMPQIAKALGRLPTWPEFKSRAQAIGMANGYARSFFEDKVWPNCEFVGAAIERAQGQHGPGMPNV